MRDLIAARGDGSRGKLKLVGTFLLLLVLVAALMAIPAIWVH